MTALTYAPLLDAGGGLAALGCVFGLAAALGARRRSRGVPLVREERHDAIGMMTVPRRQVQKYAALGWEREVDRPDLVARIDEWQAAR